MITVPWIMKAMLWHYSYTCYGNHIWKWIKPCIPWSTKAMHIRILDIKVNWFREKNPEHNMTNHMFTLNLRCWKRKEKPSQWYYQLLFIPHKPITHWFYIDVIVVMTKTCTICAVVIYTSPQPIICQFMALHTKPWVTHAL